MGNNQSNSNTVFHGGSLKHNDQMESQTNYIQLEEHTSNSIASSQPAQRKSRLQFLSCLQKLNCISSMRKGRLPDWFSHIKHQLTHNHRYSQHKWSSELLREVEQFKSFKEVQEQYIFEVTKASEQSYFDSSEYIARRKDSWRVNRASTISSPSSLLQQGQQNNTSTPSFNAANTQITLDKSNTIINSSEPNKQDPQQYGNILLQTEKQQIIEREKKLESIIENTELLQESLQDHRNSIFQIKNEPNRSRTSSKGDEGQLNHVMNENNNVLVSALLNGITGAMEDYQKTMMQEEEEYDKMFRSLNRYKEITRVLQRHMQNVAKNPLAFLLQKYVELFGFTYDAIKLSQPSMYLKIITEEVSDFISFMVDLLRVYYRLDYLLISQTTTQSQKDRHNDETTQMFFNIDNLSNFICTILFSFDNLYRKMSKLFSEVDDHFQLQFRQQIDKKQNISLAQFGVRTEFHLNEQTLALFKKPGDNSNKYLEQPYIKAIEHIKGSQITKSPLQKLKILLKIYEMIEQEIKDFYDSNNIKQQLSCDADNFLGIIQYIIIKAKTYNIYSDLKMIEYFVKNSSSKSASSYKLITLQGCVYHISSSS